MRYPVQKQASDRQAYAQRAARDQEEQATQQASARNQAGLKAGILNLAKQSGVEFTEKTISEYVNRFSDNLILGDRSEMERYVQALMESGMDYDAAQKAARIEYYIKQPLLAGLGGMISDAIMGGVANAFEKAGIYGK